MKWNEWTPMNDYCWAMQSPTSWVFMERKGLETYSRIARVSRIAPTAWTVFIEGQHKAQVESWEEARGLVAVLLGVRGNDEHD